MNYYQIVFRPNFRDNEFFEGRTYIYKSELELKKGDYVVATTKFGYAIAVIYEKNEVDDKYDYCTESVSKIVVKLDGNYYEEREKQEQIQLIEKSLNRKTQEMSKIMQYETLAKYDTEAKELLEKYKSLKNNTCILPQNEEYLELPF